MTPSCRMSKGTDMTWSVWVGLALLLAVNADGLADMEGTPPGAAPASVVSDDADPYLVITQRNVFGLKPPPPPPAPPKDAAAALPEVRLTGFMRKGAPWKVLLSVTPASPDGHQHGLTFYLTMVEGDKEGDVELVKAYPVEGKVDIINSGTPMTLSLEKEQRESPVPPPAPYEVPEVLRLKPRVTGRRIRPRSALAGRAPIQSSADEGAESSDGTVR